MVTDQGLVSAGPDVEGDPVYAAYDSQGGLKGVAFIGVGNGYAGPIKVLFSFDPGCRCVNGSRVLQSNETPGFGDKLDTDPEFRKNFHALDVTVDPEGTGLANAIITVKHGTKTKPWEIDGISGATLSSKGMAQAANAGSQRAVPAIVRALPTLSRQN